jgi:hypothetical protein
MRFLALLFLLCVATASAIKGRKQARDEIEDDGEDGDHLERAPVLKPVSVRTAPSAVNGAAADVYGSLSRLPPPVKGTPRFGRVTLSGGAEPVLIQHDGTFVIPQVPVGSYSVTIEFEDIVWPQLRLDVSEGKKEGSVRIRARTNDVVGDSVSLPGGDDAGTPIEVAPIGKHGYYIPREEFSVMSFFKNPMMLMMVVSMGMVGLMKLMPQDELRQQMKEISQMASGNSQDGPAAIAKKKE